MNLKQIFLSLVVSSCLAVPGVMAQSEKMPLPPMRPKAKPTNARPATPEQSRSNKFVHEVVASAVAIPQADPQDRLRVLNAAVVLTARTEPKTAAKLAEEAVQIESRLIAAGETPAASVVASGYASCPSVVEFVQGIYPTAVSAAEQSLIGAVGKCEKQTLESVRNRVEAAAQQGVFAPRLTMVLMNKLGKSSAWSQGRFVETFGALPSDDAKSSLAEAPDFAAIFVSMAASVEKDVAAKAGLKLLGWLGKLDGDERNLAVNMATSTLKKVFGETGYNELLQGDVIAAQVARTAGAPGHVAQQEEESASPIEAANARGRNQEDALKALPVSLRARQAAADGFMTARSDKQAAEKYFDIAFAAANEAWSQRSSSEQDAARRAAAMMEEVSEAAAHVDPLNALTRAQALREPSAQAVSMIAVARVVMTNDLPR